MTYAIIDIGGKQYRVEEGDSVLVDRVGEDEGAKVSPRAVLYADGKTAVMDGADLGKVRIDAVVAEHVKGPKLRVNTYRPKKRFKRRMGHRSALSRLEIRKIRGPAAAKAAAGSAEGRAKKEPAKKEPAKKTPATKQPARQEEKED
ncbi:MAG: 50S ribosomal protein L21 [Solirubrobacterales bacterium]